MMGKTMTLERKFRILTIMVFGLVLILAGLIAFSLFKPVEGATSPGTCLPINKGGTGCDYETMRNNITADYSAEEQPTGELWANGKPIYRRVFTGSISGAAGAVIVTTLISGPYVDEHIDSGGWWNISTNNFGNMSLGGAANKGVYTSHVQRRVDTGSLIMETQSEVQRTNANYSVWVEYTKL